jgi:2'-5' RNA ligase
MKSLKTIAMGVFLITGLALAAEPVTLTVSEKILQNEELPFVSHRGKGPFDNVLAMNIQYEPVKLLRDPIEKTIGRKLDYLKSWDPQGEAHVTTVTPVEYAEVLRSKLTMAEIDAIATKNKIQSSDLKILGIGSGAKTKGNKKEETFFILVESLNLRKIRQEIYDEFVRKGGSPSAWDPAWFFPHVTIGYTQSDLHEGDGVMKNIGHSWDKRFVLRMQ